MRQFMPDRLDGKIVLTNTVTATNIEELRSRGVAKLITTTPDFEGRSFGTNVIEAALLALLGKTWADVKPEDYERVLHEPTGPRVVGLNYVLAVVDGLSPPLPAGRSSEPGGRAADDQPLTVLFRVCRFDAAGWCLIEASYRCADARIAASGCQPETRNLSIACRVLSDHDRAESAIAT